MIWLASYPRSGNTFFRNILYEVYAIESTDLNFNALTSGNIDYSQIPVVKTHMLPSQISALKTNRKSVYIVRDGRDATTSLYHHRKDIKKIDKRLYFSFVDIIFGWGNLFKTTWSGHVRSWEKEANIIIKFEDLIQNPVKEVEKLRSIMNLPQPNLERIPTFEKQKAGKIKYGVDKKDTADTEMKNENFSAFFRSGKIGGYKTEMPRIVQLLFLVINMKTLRKYYSK